MEYSYRQKVKKILRIALPSGANSLLDIIVLTLSLLFMGMLSKEHIIGVSIGMQYIMMFFTINTIFYVGTNVQISRFFGVKDSVNASKVFITLFVFCCICALPLIVVGYMFIDNFIQWMDITARAAALCRDFLYFSVLTLPIMILKNIITSAFAAIGDTLSIFLVRIFTTCFCIFINFFLIFQIPFEIFGWNVYFGMGLDIIGAGLANVLTTFLELIILLWLVYKRGRFFTQTFTIAWQYLKKAMQIGIPSGIERALTLGSLVLTTKFLANFGDIAIAGSQIGSRIEAFSFMPGFGFMVAAMALTGQNLGANKITFAQDFNKTILQISSVIMGILGVIMAIFCVPLSRIFLDDDEVVRISAMYLIAVGFSQVPLIWVFVLDGVLRGAGVTKVSLIINATSIWCFRILPMWIAISLGGGIMWIFVMIFVETYIRAGIFYFAYSKGIWKKPGHKL
ncbi:putative Na+ driven multidrug efflux pump, MatE family protein [Helicobacter fennelliae]|uniref:Multidrug-efflux transporter n=1 Tax=Helicobacter fennelliae TaxID=215 RepID=A0A2X3B8Z1_9HELI|nr:MATE family efflux transporter [Helicobacter fennelliae]SQB98217.1 putative Na+ driven multidrug efflux pump, MatE family protein [Helicobacter fennelliae]